jgi:hypothetical protein
VRRQVTACIGLQVIRISEKLALILGIINYLVFLDYTEDKTLNKISDYFYFNVN